MSDLKEAFDLDRALEEKFRTFLRRVPSKIYSVYLRYLASGMPFLEIVHEILTIPSVLTSYPVECKELLDSLAELQNLLKEFPVFERDWSEW